MIDFQRYSRQMLLPEFGLEGQKKLQSSSILCVGAGGLASGCLPYLAGSGIGKIGIVDDDSVSISNLHRQIIHAEASVGLKKTDSAKQFIQRLNTQVEVQTWPVRLNNNNISDIIGEYDLVVDCSDNFDTKYLLNEWCQTRGRPLVYAAAQQGTGVLLCIEPNGPCLQCWQPYEDVQKINRTCSEMGVFGAVPGVLGALQAAEAIKIVLGVQDRLCGKVLAIDLFNMFFEFFSYEKNVNCSICSGVSDEVLTKERNLEKGSAEISWDELANWLQTGRVLIDIRELDEQYSSPILADMQLPFSQLAVWGGALSNSTEYALICSSGKRSAIAASYLSDLGIKAFTVRTGLEGKAKGVYEPIG